MIHNFNSVLQKRPKLSIIIVFRFHAEVEPDALYVLRSKLYNHTVKNMHTYTHTCLMLDVCA